MRRDDLPIRTYQYTCQSGNTSALIVPSNAICHLEEIEIDSANISGNISIVNIEVRDTFTPQGGSSTTVTRKRVSLKCGDVIHVDTDGNQQLIGTVQINSSYSGPIVGIGVSVE